MSDTNSDYVDDFLAHYGVKGMKWGVKRSDAQLARASGGRQNGSDGASDSAPKQGMSRKKKIAIGAGVVGGVALVALGAYAVNKQIDTNKLRTLGEMRKQAEANLAGKKAAQAQIQAFGKKSKWELASELPAKPKKSPMTQAEYKAQAQAKVKARADELIAKSGSKPMGKAARRKAAEQQAIQEHFNKFAKKSFLDLATELPSAPKQPKLSRKEAKSRTNEAVRRATETQQINNRLNAVRGILDKSGSTPARKASSSYTSRDRKNDTKLYGTEGAARIQKRIAKGALLSEARRKEATRQYGVKAARVGMNIGSAGRRESKDYERLRKQAGRG